MKHIRTLDWRLLMPCVWLIVSIGICYIIDSFPWSRGRADIIVLIFLSWYIVAPVGVLCSLVGIAFAAIKAPRGKMKAIALVIYLLAFALSSFITLLLIRWGEGIQQT